MRSTIALALSIAVAVMGCSSTVVPSPSTALPVQTPAPVASVLPSASPSATATPTPDPANPTEIPTPQASLIPSIFAQIDPQKVTAGCDGGPFGANVSASLTHETWILHCPTGIDIESFRSNLEDQIKSLGATFIGGGKVTSNLPANAGEAVYNSDFTLNDLVGEVHVTFLPTSAGPTLVITIDQARA